MNDANSLGQPVGPEVSGWVPPPLPGRDPLAGRFCRLEPLDSLCHAAALREAFALDPEGRMWTYLPYGPFAGEGEFRGWLDRMAAGPDSLSFAVVPQGGDGASGLCAYLRLQPAEGTIEIGHLAFSPLLQKTPAATEAVYLLMERVFALGFRRCEWKCHDLNAPSHAAARRFGFAFEGVWRQATVVKGRSRDTAWYAVVDGDWPRLQAAFRRWLAPENFDGEGRQRVRLSELTAARP